MSEREKEIAETLGTVLSGLPDDKKEYLLGVMKGISVMSEVSKADDAAKDAV